MLPVLGRLSQVLNRFGLKYPTRKFCKAVNCPAFILSTGWKRLREEDRFDLQLTRAKYYLESIGFFQSKLPSTMEGKKRAAASLTTLIDRLANTLLQSIASVLPEMVQSVNSPSYEARAEGNLCFA